MHGFTFHCGLGRAARLACLAGAWWPLMACQPTAPSGPSTPVASASGVTRNDRSAQEQLWRANPSPVHGFDVVFEAHGAPGPFASFMANAHYQSFNCNFVTSEWAGTRSQPTKTLPLVVSRLDPNRYQVSFYRDGMMDEDYYGKGVCKWTLTGVTLGLKATGSKDETSYAFDLAEDTWRDGGHEKLYYWAGSYPKMKTQSDVAAGVGGVRSPGDLLPGFGDNVFSITASVKAKP